jgi:hypothetical protein
LINAIKVCLLAGSLLLNFSYTGNRFFFCLFLANYNHNAIINSPSTVNMHAMLLEPLVDFVALMTNGIVASMACKTFRFCRNTRTEFEREIAAPSVIRRDIETSRTRFKLRENAQNGNDDMRAKALNITFSCGTVG